MSEENQYNTGFSNITDHVIRIVDGYRKAPTNDLLHECLKEILILCDSADYFGDEIDSDDIRRIVEKKLWK